MFNYVFDGANDYAARVDLFRRIYRDDEVHRLTLFDPAAMLEILRETGFDACAIDRYNATQLPTGLTAFLGRKPVQQTP